MSQFIDYSKHADITDPFEPETEAQQTQAQQTQALTLFELNAMVRAVLQHTLANHYWIVAEISELRVASNGHCYLELIQKDGAGSVIVAKARANIWRPQYVKLASRFKQATGQLLCAGMKVLVCVSVTFHEHYGYSLVISDIDPAFTLGDLAQQRRRILQQLTDDGVIDLNKELPLPRPISRIAVISSKTAAGYGDFCNQLSQSGFAFKLKLFEAAMQGERVESTVIEALDRIAAEAEQWDVVVIIRGGGATTDLSGFDSYLLAANVAQFPLPVFTGIGHERDETIIDIVAHTRLKTPTAVAAFLIDAQADEAGRLHELRQRLAMAVNSSLQQISQRTQALNHRLQLATMQNMTQRHRQLDALNTRFRVSYANYANRQREKIVRFSSRLEMSTLRRMQTEKQDLMRMPDRLSRALSLKFDREKMRLTLAEKSVKLAGPDRILAMGFSITLHKGKAVRNADALTPGDELTTLFAQGKVQSVVTKKDDTHA